ncbi:hypothetical protein C1H46_001807 [Malus baccata]|uniref:Uncharacterized protein n=1 Tax=Malus baccata TaxID=106549 RepID=A0A540NNK0_MALBA|nr:hypothetical protein C1H46_001807 [Malus baccata]
MENLDIRGSADSSPWLSTSLTDYGGGLTRFGSRVLMRFKRNLLDFITEVIPNHNHDNYTCQRWVPSPLMTTKVIGGGSGSQPSRIHKAGRLRKKNTCQTRCQAWDWRG